MGVGFTGHGEEAGAMEHLKGFNDGYMKVFDLMKHGREIRLTLFTTGKRGYDNV